MRTRLSPYVPAILVACGLIAISAGAWLTSPSAGLVVAGLALIAGGLIVAFAHGGLARPR